MKEFRQLIEAYERYKELQKSVALATVVQVDGSAYRRPGARMLVSEDGNLHGAISGGCLEGDALRKAQAVIFQQESKLVTYDTTDEDDQKFGIGLGCNGIIHVLIEPIDYSSKFNPLELLKIAIADRQPSILTIVFSLNHSQEDQIGTVLLAKSDSFIGHHEKLSAELVHFIEDKTKSTNRLNKAQIPPQLFGELTLFLELINPPIRILLFGAGNDTIPLADLASNLGFEVVLIDGRSSHATKQRFPKAKEIIIGTADEVALDQFIDSQTVALLMTHNFEYEAVILARLVKLDLPYIGILGPKKKSDKLIERLEVAGIKVDRSNVYGPVGLDIGAENSDEIALSALAEIKAVLAGKSGNFLREKLGPIHDITNGIK
jgi:xanthine/CO dehydrogenase XdhC/CoxF family maturation factor